MLCAALYPNVVQVGFRLEKRGRRLLSSPPLHFRLCRPQVRAPQENFKMTSKGAMKTHPKANELRFATKNDGYVHLHPSSVNYTVRCYTGGGQGVDPARSVTFVCASGPPLHQPVPGLPREGENEPRLHQGLQHGVGLPAGAAGRRAGQLGAPQGSLCHLPGRRLDPIRCRFPPGQEATPARSFILTPVSEPPG